LQSQKDLTYLTCLFLLPRLIIIRMRFEKGVCCVNTLFGETLRKMRMEKGLSQVKLAKELFVYNSTVARWENGNRLPNATMIARIARFFGVDVNTLFSLAVESDEVPNVIMVDDNEVILSHGLTVLRDVMPNAAVMGFIRPVEAIEYAKANRVALAVLDIELGTTSGLELCHTLLAINPCTNIVFLTAYADYSLDAWKTQAIGFMLKPLTQESVKEQLKKLRYPFSTGGADR